MSFFENTFIVNFKNKSGFTGNFYKIDDLVGPGRLITRLDRKRITLERIIKKSCGKSIGDNYIIELSHSLIDEPDKFDFITATSTPDNITSLDDLSGFMVVQKGECELYPDNYCLNLICANKIGGTLMALYLYIIINDNNYTNKIGLLELANSYYNVGGLCMYTKYGFKVNTGISTETCFKYFPPNLPMTVDLNDYGSDQNEQTNLLMNILNNRITAFEKPPICNIRDKNRQLLFSLALNLQLPKFITQPKLGELRDPNLWEYVFGQYRTHHKLLGDGRDIDYYGLLAEINQTYENIDNFIQSFDNITDERVNNLLNRFVIEPQTPQQTTIQTTILPERSTRSTRSTTKRPLEIDITEKGTKRRGETRRGGTRRGGTRRTRRTRKKKTRRKHKKI